MPDASGKHDKKRRESARDFVRNGGQLSVLRRSIQYNERQVRNFAIFVKFFSGRLQSGMAKGPAQAGPLDMRKYSGGAAVQVQRPGGAAQQAEG
ncbi:hypothetical protein [uncultured Subdoligranulum sp.]|uniref:hypothetical protein n=1 Tax=uncultured Subdoligranulum sp. TaxID=512298 RepID=UPI00262955DC|nr:hypothetical protein [uncultured Subdoligranulum sp.]